MTASTLDERFIEGGTLRQAGGDRPLLLTGDRVWMVQAGRIDVFATRTRDGEAVGGREHLFRVAQGGVIFGIDPDPETGMALLAVGATHTRIAEFDGAEFRAQAADPLYAAEVWERVHAWTEAVYGGLVSGAPTRSTVTLVQGCERAVAAGAVVRVEAPVAWVAQRTGESRILGRAAGTLRPGDFVPLAERGWVEASADSVLAVAPDEAWLLPGAATRVWEGLQRFHGMVLGIVAERSAEAGAAHRERREQQERTGRATMQSALARLACTLDGVEDATGMRLREPEGAGAEDLLRASVRLVMGAQGIGAEPTHKVDAETWAREPLAAIAQAYRVRTRKVVLREDWWRQDAGPLLGRLSDGSQPVALLPRRGGGYEVHDPGRRTRTRITPEVAAGLAPFAYTFYRPFADTALTLREVVAFGLQGCRADLLTVALVAGAMALLAMVGPLAIAALFDHVIPGAERGQLMQLMAVLLVCALATAIFQLVRGVALLRIESKAGSAIQAAVWDRLLGLPLPFFRDYSAGDLAVRAMGVEEIRKTLSGAVVTALLGGLFSLSNFALLFSYDASLALIGLGLVSLALSISVGISYLQLRSQREILRLRSRTSGVVLQLLAGISKLKMVGAEVHAFGVWARLFSAQREQQYRTRTLSNVLATFNAGYPVVCSLVLYYMAAGRLAEGTGFSTGSFLGFMAAFTICLMASLSTSSAVIAALTVVPMYEQVKPVLHSRPEVHSDKEDPGELTGAIELQHVHFRYRPDGPLTLRDVSVRVRPGEFVAFVGPSGSGKSTLFRLLLGFETPESGSVSFDEQDLSALDIQAVRRQMGVVMQSGRLMAGDLFTNIVGASQANLDDAWTAARMSGLAEDIEAMPMGMHTVVSEGGSTLSGGQRQRLMIARAIVNRPRILLFDEATSALDNRTQAIVSESLDRLQATRIVVAHRLSTIQNADRIYVVKAGSVIESGSYDELLAMDGVFADMARRQLA